jgi:transposase
MASDRRSKPLARACATLPPYSPDFNPIEMAFAKLKAALRAAEARTIPDLWQAIADALRRFTPQECANYLAAAGYDAT